MANKDWSIAIKIPENVEATLELGPAFPVSASREAPSSPPYVSPGLKLAEDWDRDGASLRPIQGGDWLPAWHRSSALPLLP